MHGLAAAGLARQKEAARRADAAAAAAGRAAGQVWRDVLALLLAPGAAWEARRRALALFARLGPASAGEMKRALVGAARWGHQSAAAMMRATLPEKYAAAALVRKAVRGGGDGTAAGPVRGPLPEGAGGYSAHGGGIHPRAVDGGHGRGAAGAGPRRAGRHAPAAEHRPARDQRRPAAHALLEDDAPALSLSLDDLLAPFRGGTGGDLWSLLFPAPTPAEVHAVVYATDWRGRLADSTKLAPPELLAGILSTGLALGKSQREVAKELLPAVDGVRSTARRLARTEALRLGNAMQMRCHRQLGDLVAGYTVYDPGGPTARPEHVARSGTTYYKEPGPGQLGYDAMPHPPHEPDGSLAWNCRCYLTPTLRDVG